MKRYLLSSVILAVVVILTFLFGCSEDVFINQPKENMLPEVWLSSGPVEGITTGYQVHFYWGGWDPDGEIAYYEFVVVDAYPFGFNPEDTTGLDKWYRTSVHDSVFKVSADDSTATVKINNNDYTYYDRMHTFFLRGVDLQGKRSVAVSRSFTAWTLAPYVRINMPPKNDVYSRVIKFEWTGYDPIDEPANTQDPESVRYMWGRLIDSDGNYNTSFDLLGDLNQNPWRYVDWWQPWISYDAPDDSGKAAVIGDEEVLISGDYHVFAIQAMDDAGAVTAIFDENNNFRKFIVSDTAVPMLYMTESFLGTYVFLGRNFRPIMRDLPPGIPLNFHWRATAYRYGGEIVGYRYGWDIADVNNPADWPVSFSPYHTTAPEIRLYSGTHTFFVEVIDNSGFSTLGQIQINVIPFSMERNLLWMDDFYSEDFLQKDYVMPTETEHDNFWLDICSRADGFDPEIDIYDATLKNYRPAPITTIGKYKNIIWTYSSSPTQSTWHDIVLFTPETSLQTGTQLSVNYISLFLAKGGHMWTLGRADKSGGIAATLIQNALLFPMSLRCEIAGNEEGCETDTSGVNSMGYKDYCITMLDKVDGAIRQDETMPRRDIQRYDVLTYAYRADDDTLTAAHPELPEQLEMWETAVAPGTFFYPQNENGPGGFTYVEVYDPEYWMGEKYAESQLCFHPMYRMVAYNARSALNHTTVALWLTRYADIKPDIDPAYPEGVAAPSFHFGFPLWFFNREQADMIVELIFSKWDILID
jgi:hypothetical protein